MLRHFRPMSYRTSPADLEGMPPGVPHIIGNEAAERFSFYGMKAVLAVFMVQYLHLMDGRGGRWHERGRSHREGPPLQWRGLSHALSRRAAGGHFHRQIPHHHRTLAGLLRRPCRARRHGNVRQLALVADGRAGTHRPRLRRHQTLRLRPRRRPVRRAQRASADAHLQLVLLLHQHRRLRLDAAHAVAARMAWPALGLRRAGRPDGNRHPGVLDGKETLHPRARRRHAASCATCSAAAVSQ